MAVPKKRKSKSKTKLKRLEWQNKALIQSKKALALSKKLKKEEIQLWTMKKEILKRWNILTRI